MSASFLCLKSPISSRFFKENNMLYFVFGFIAAIVLLALLVWLANDSCEWYNFMAAVVAVFMGAVMAIVLVGYCILLKDWLGSGYKAAVLNREYGTSYTREEIFYASDVIDTVRQLDRTRMEINGDLMKDE